MEESVSIQDDCLNCKIPTKLHSTTKFQISVLASLKYLTNPHFNFQDDSFFKKLSAWLISCPFADY